MSALSNFFKVIRVIQVIDSAAVPILQVIASTTGNKNVAAIAAGATLAEQLLGPGTGAQKKQVATAIVNAVQPGIDQAALGASFDEIIGLVNLLGAAMNKAEAIPVTVP